MIIDDKDAVRRLNSPMNLINKLRDAKGDRRSAMSLFGVGRREKVEKKEEETPKIFNPFEKISTEPQAVVSISLPASLPPATTLDNILENNDSQIKLGLAHDNALTLLNDSVRLLASKLEDVKADKLPQVVTAASKVVESIRKERSEAQKNNKDSEVHYHFYTPQQKKVEDYEVIDVK